MDAFFCTLLVALIIFWITLFWFSWRGTVAVEQVQVYQHAWPQFKTMVRWTESTSDHTSPVYNVVEIDGASMNGSAIFMNTGHGTTVITSPLGWQIVLLYLDEKRGSLCLNSTGAGATLMATHTSRDMSLNFGGRSAKEQVKKRAIVKFTPLAAISCKSVHQIIVHCSDKRSKLLNGNSYGPAGLVRFGEYDYCRGMDTVWAGLQCDDQTPSRRLLSLWVDPMCLSVAPIPEKVPFPVDSDDDDDWDKDY